MLHSGGGNEDAVNEGMDFEGFEVVDNIGKRETNGSGHILGKI